MTGPKSVLDTLQNVYTEDISFNGLEENTTLEVSLNENYRSQRLSFDLNKVIVFIPVEKFTESTINIPINYINVPDSIELKAIPNEVQLKFMTPLTRKKRLTNPTAASPVVTPTVSGSAQCTTTFPTGCNWWLKAT